ncbi:sensor histidine kinase [Actinokineospora sp. 24-640]
MTEPARSSDAASADASGPGDIWRAPLLAPKVARGIVLAAFAAFCAIAFTFVVYAGTPFWECVLAAVYLVIIFALQVYFGRPETQVRAPLAYAVLLAQAFLVVVPLTQFGQAWVAMPVLLAANAVLVLPARVGWPMFGLVLGVMVFVQWLLGGTLSNLGEVLLGGTLGALEFYGLTRLARLITLVHAARAELGEAAVAGERLRFARDLHDLLGLSLSTVGPKVVVAQEVMATEPERARAELGEILTIARHALADVRLVASGYRETSLNEESRTVESILADSDIDVRIDVSHGELPVPVRTLAVAVLRAGASEVLQREAVNSCSITMRRAGDAVELDIVDDGEPEESEATLPCTPPDTADTLIARVQAVGGSLSRTTLAKGGGTRLRLRMPLGQSAEGEFAPSPSDEQTPRAISQLAGWLMPAVFIGFVVTGVLIAVLGGRDARTVLIIAGFAVASLVVQLFYVSRVDLHIRPPMSYLVLLLQAFLVYMPLLLIGPAWWSVPGFLAGSALLLLRPAAGWLVFIAVLVSVPVAKAANLVHPLIVANTAGGLLITGLVVYGLTWMGRAVYQLRAARVELARIAVADERMRFARDLHDLLGLSLSAITLKTELAQRLMAVDQDRARQELAEIIDISRLALADVRLVANGYRELSLNEESRSAESVLVAADVDVRLEMHYGELSPEVRTVLATVLREGVTNVLRHSAKGARCEITVRQVDRMVTMEIVNNGVAGQPGLSPGGSGLRNLSARVARLGGQLTAGLSPDGTFRLSARVPS